MSHIFVLHIWRAFQKILCLIGETGEVIPVIFSQGGTPLHYYVWTDSVKKDKTDFLVSLLTTAEVEVDCRTEDGSTPLHLAVKVKLCCVYLA